MKIAVFSDIHGNLKALKEVLEQIKEKNKVSDEISRLVSSLYSDEKRDSIVFMVRSVLYGAAVDKHIDISLVRSCLEAIIK